MNNLCIFSNTNAKYYVACNSTVVPSKSIIFRATKKFGKLVVQYWPFVSGSNEPIRFCPLIMATQYPGISGTVNFHPHQGVQHVGILLSGSPVELEYPCIAADSFRNRFCTSETLILILLRASPCSGSSWASSSPWCPAPPSPLSRL